MASVIQHNIGLAFSIAVINNTFRAFPCPRVNNMIAMLLLTCSMFVCAAFLRLMVRSPLARYFGDTPDHRKVHLHIIPRLGGLGMVLSFLVIFALRQFLPEAVWPRTAHPLSIAVALVGIFMLGAGTLDDVRSLDFKLKFLFQFMMATAVVVVLGHKFETLAILNHRFVLHGFGPILSVFWIVAIMNAFNIIDGIDGLAGGVALCGFAAVAFIARANGAVSIFNLCACMAGLTLAFLRFNFSRRYKMFLGDTGSQFLGAVLALLALEAQAMPGVHFSFFVPLLIVGYPLLDLGVAMIRRFLKGHGRKLSRRLLTMFAADNEHMHHKLVYLGLSHVQSTFLLLILTSGIAATAICISRLMPPFRWMVIAYMAVAVVLILNRLGFIGIKSWVTLPRTPLLPEKIVGVVEPDDVFFHSLKSFKQDKFEFLSMPGNLTRFLGDDLVAVTLYNAASGRFEERWSMALRASEFQDCPAIVVADREDIERVKTAHPQGFRAIHFMEKPLRIPELMRELEKFSRVREKSRKKPPNKGKFSLAELAVRNNERG
jgi:UDP-GlcNAc:undecaprenyl-phosphate GlcNAc-1-phosphate transferase